MRVMDEFEYDVCVVGIGRVGLPLALSFLDVGLRVVGVHLDPHIRDSVNAGKMPFVEPGFDALVARREVRAEDSLAYAARARSVVVTVGTPLHTHIETDISQIRRVLEEIQPHLRRGQLLCLRSTVAPGTTRYVAQWIERHTDLRVGDTFRVAFCPERIAEGRAREELRSLPQIVGAADPESAEAARALFAHLAPEVMCTDYVSAELVKLFNNIARYVHFAVANQFALIADTFGANIHEIRALANHDYPRNPIAMPGLTGGTCLRKDFGMISEWSPYPDLLVSAWKMNEYIPAFLVRHLEQRTPLHDKRVAVLGYTFKRNTDDTRDSLAPKLVRYIERSLPLEIRISDAFLPDPIPEIGARNWQGEDAVDGADCVFVAMNHDGHAQTLRSLGKKQPETWIADIWNVGGVDRVFYQASDLA